MLHYVIFIFLLLHVSALGTDHPVVETSLGLVRGHYKQSYGGRTYAAFEGIPYAKPPVGTLRFKEPQHIEPWSGFWNATTTHTCLQLNFLANSEIAGSEDCLYLNVYVAKDLLTSNKKLDVVAHIHGGAFMLGSPVMAGPKYLMDRDIIYVNFNYRLGILGFLSTNDEVVPGNNGMKDQVLALKWIQNNIEKFGGNPNSVTLTGLSAGGAAVHFHYISPLSKGLFHRGLSQSGTILAPWALQEAPLEKARKLAAAVGCDSPSSKEFVECMRQRSAYQLVQNTKEFSGYHSNPFAPFALVIEKRSASAFLTDIPYRLLESGYVNDVPWITSVTTEEGIFPVITFLDKLDEIDKQWNDVLPHLLDYNYTVASSQKVAIAQKIKEFYFNKEKLSQDNIQSLIKLFGDRIFVLSFEKAAQMQAKVCKSPVYSYVYGYKAEAQSASFFGTHYGVSHGADGAIMYDMNISGKTVDQKLSHSDEYIKDVFLDIVASFAKNGTPVVKRVKWDPLDNSADFKYLFIHKPDDIAMSYMKEMAPKEFWHSLPIKEDDKDSSVKDEL